MKHGLYMKRLIIFSIFAVVVYTIVAIIFQYETGNEISNQLTLGWYGFFGVELINMAVLKKEKLRSNQIEGNKQ